MLAFVALTAALGIDACAQLPSTTEKLACYTDSIPSLRNTPNLPFVACLWHCVDVDHAKRGECIKNCTYLRNPSPASQECLIECQDVRDPIHQSQCLAACSTRNRLTPNDVADSCDRCKLFVQYLQLLAPQTFLVDELEKAVAGVCSSKIDLFPVCQAISTIGYSALEAMVMNGTTYEEICQKMSLCNVDGA